jgi:hypothetical protein
LQESIVECIVRVIGVDHDTVIECVEQNKCDDLAAMYHMIEHNLREVLNEKTSIANLAAGGASAASPSSAPPLSPTSLSPFFPSAKPANVTEIFNELLTPVDETTSLLTADRLLNLRRHTLGPGQTPVFTGPAFPPSLDYRGILPQTNLMQNLPLVSNLPPESFSVKGSIHRNSVFGPKTLLINFHPKTTEKNYPSIMHITYLIFL